jgi:hypothetical protein
MMRHEDEKLWQYAADELDAGDRCLVEAHLEDCPECRDSLAAVQLARGTLASARRAWPALEWRSTDDAIGALVERRLAASARGPWVRRFALAGAVGVVALVVAVSRDRAAPAVSPPPLAAVTALPTAAAGPLTRVDRAQGLVRVGREAAPVEGGAELSGGDVLRTSLGGKAFIHLPDASHMRVAGGTQLALTRLGSDDVALTLERGRVAVRASHAPRRGFAVHTGGLTVHVVGTVFAVANSGEAVEVSVAEGRVKVDLPSGDVVMVGAGQRIRLDSRSERPERLAVSEAVERELSELTEVADTATSVEQQVAEAPAPVVAAAEPGRALPRLSASEAASRQVVLPEARAVAQLAAPEPDPGPPPPSPVDASPAPAAMATPEVDEWATLPVTAQAARAPAPPKAPPARRAPSPVDLETLFLERATASLQRGECERFLLGLEDIAQDSERSPRTELARVLRARCFAAQLRPRQAMNEFRKYLTDYPAGQFSVEAREAVRRE